MGTFKYVLGHYFRDIEFATLSAASQAHYRYLAKVVERLLGDCGMAATTTAMVAKVRNAVSVGTANNMRAFIS